MTSPDEPTEGAQAFLEGRRNSLTSADIDPVGTRLFANYQEAMKAKSHGDPKRAAELLEMSCTPPSCYHGHYEELSKMWRQWNREALAAGHYLEVVKRVSRTARYDDEMNHTLLNANEWVRRQNYPPNHFDRYRKPKITDIRHLAKGAAALRDRDVAAVTEDLALSLARRRQRS